MASQSLIDELTAACADADLGRRATILAQLTNLFISGRAAYDEQQIALFDDVLIRLSEQVEIVARTRLSERLASISDPPCGIIRTLAKDQNIAVALPVLTDCELDDDTLTEVARTSGQGHLEAIARRPSVSEPVTEILTERGNKTVLLSVIGNPGARFCESSYSHIVERSGGDPDLAASVWRRSNVPRHHLVRLFIEASDAARIKLEGIDPKRGKVIREVVAAISRDMQGQARSDSRDYQVAIEEIRRINSEGRLNNSALKEFARANKFDEVAVALSMMCDLPIEVVERGLVQDRSEVIVVFARAAGLDWDATRAILQMEARSGAQSRQHLELALGNFAKLTLSTARKAIQFYQMRARSGAIC
jgi:uncharacterized protein (DUF2336 family)